MLSPMKLMGRTNGRGGNSTLNLAIWTPPSVIAGQIYRERGCVKSTRGGGSPGLPMGKARVSRHPGGGIFRPMVKNSSLDAAPKS